MSDIKDNENKKKVGRPKIYTDEELKENKKRYDVKYLRERYHKDAEFREECKIRVRKYNKKNAPEEVT